MKKRTKIVISVSVVLLLLAMFRFFAFSSTWGLSEATLHYDDHNTNITVRLEREDWFAISRIFNFCHLEEKWSKCIVNEDLYITAGGTTYYIAQDGCSQVYLPDRDLVFAPDEIKPVWDILEKYGVPSPWNPND